MKVLFYNGSLRLGGAEKILVEILKGLNKEDKEIDLLISDEISEDNFFEKDIPDEVKLTYLIPESLILKTMKYKKKKKNLYNKIMYNYCMYKEQNEKKRNLKKFLNHKEYDVVIDFDMGLSKNIDEVCAKKKIAWIHSPIDSWYKKEDKIKRLGKRLKKYDILVTICNDLKEKTGILYPFLKNKLVRIYNPFDIERIKKLAMTSEGIESEKIKYLKESYIVAVARLDNYSKDFYTLLRGFKKAKVSGIKEKLFILGEGEEKEQILKWIEELDLQDEVILMGGQRNPYVWMKNSQLFVHSSRFEGLPTVLIESMICETVVVSSDCPTGPKEILKNGEYGKLYPVGDFNKLGEILIEMLKEKKKIDEFKEKLELRIQDFSKESSIRSIEKILRQDEANGK